MAEALTRSELYALVWEAPVTTLAARFGISDVALHKTCRRYDIPTPPPGHWAKKAHGKRTVQTPLPSGDDVRIIIAPRPGGGLTPGVKEARDKAVAASAKPNVLASRRDPRVACTLARLSKGKPDGEGLVSVAADDCFVVRASPASAERLGRVLDRLLAAASARQFEVKGGAEGNTFEADGEALGFVLVEIVDRTDHAPTEAEQRAVQAWEGRRQRAEKRGDWRLYMDLAFRKPAIPTFDYRPSGRLSLRLVDRYVGYGARRTFADGKTQDLEQMADAIVVGVATYAAAIRERREERERRERQWQEAEHRRLAAEQRACREKRRVLALDEILDSHDRAVRLRRYLRNVDAVGRERPAAFTRFLTWASAHLAETEAALSPSTVDARLVSLGLFTAEDEEPPWDG